MVELDQVLKWMELNLALPSEPTFQLFEGAVFSSHSLRGSMRARVTLLQ